MAYREHGMWEILDVLRRIHRGESQRSVARSIGRCRPTLARYMALAKDVGWVPEGTLAPSLHRQEESDDDRKIPAALWLVGFGPLVGVTAAVPPNPAEPFAIRAFLGLGGLPFLSTIPAGIVT